MVSLPMLVPNASSAAVTTFSPVRWAAAGAAKPRAAIVVRAAATSRMQACLMPSRNREAVFDRTPSRFDEMLGQQSGAQSDLRHHLKGTRHIFHSQRGSSLQNLIRHINDSAG